MMIEAEIVLQGGETAIVDAADFDYLVKIGRWRGITRHGRTSAACRPLGGSGRQVYMHRFILDLKRGDRRQVDHINGNPLDNRRANLRICTHGQNVANRGPTKACRSGFKGVYLNQLGSRWNAEIRVNGKKHHLGCFATAEEAARAYDIAAIQHQGDFAFQNFPGVADAK